MTVSNDHKLVAWDNIDKVGFQPHAIFCLYHYQLAVSGQDLCQPAFIVGRQMLDNNIGNAVQACVFKNEISSSSPPADAPMATM